MTIRFAAALAPLLLSAGAVPATAAEGIEPRAGVQLTGMIQFPRAQAMTIETDRRDGTKLTVRMGFDGVCQGGGLSEAWVSNVESRPVVRVRDGRFDAVLTGTARNIGEARGRTGKFQWRLTGRFVERDVVRATVTGTGEIRGRDGRVVSRCRIAEPASVRLAIRSR